MRLSQNSGVPIYQQIADSFKSDILAGKYAQGEYLPSIRGLARDLKISVITTMKAYELLEQEGLVTAEQGKGFLCEYEILALASSLRYVLHNWLFSLLTPLSIRIRSASTVVRRSSHRTTSSPVLRSRLLLECLGGLASVSL